MSSRLDHVEDARFHQLKASKLVAKRVSAEAD
jgi:hypothetical protein